jgi:hypothetical protein
MLTQNKLKEYLHYEPGTGIFRWIKKPKCSRVILGGVAGTVQTKGYRNINLLTYANKAHRLAWLYVYGEWPILQLDHINGVKDDNRICNLREANNGQNQMNKKTQRNNTSGHRNVYWRNSRNRWVVSISVEGKNYIKGSFKKLEDAVIRAEEVRKSMFGEFLCSHFNEPCVVAEYSLQEA